MPKRIILLCLVIFGGIALFSWAEEKLLNREVSEKLVCQIDLDQVKDSLTISSDNRRVAYVIRKGNKECVVLDGKERKLYYGIGHDKYPKLVFSSDSKHIAYEAKKGNKYIVVMDDTESKEYDGIFNFAFGPDDTKLIFGASINNKKLLVMDEKESKQYDYIGFTLSPNRTRCAAVAEDYKNYKRFLIIDGKEEEMPYYGLCGDITFSPNSKRMAYSVVNKDGLSVFVDGKEGKKYKFEWFPVGGDRFVFSPDSKHVAYRVEIDRKLFIVVDGNEIGPFNMEEKYVYDCRLTFSSDNKYLALELGDLSTGRSKNFVFKYNQEDKKYDCILEFEAPDAGNRNIIFSPDSRHIAYKKSTTSDYGGPVVVVVDGRKGKQYSWVGIPIFSPNSKHLAYYARRGIDLVVLDDIEGKEYGYILDHYGYFPYPNITFRTSITFSPDSKWLVYIAAEEESMKKTFVVINGEEGKRYDQILGQISFDSPDTFHYLARKGDKIYLVEEKIK